MLNHGIVLLVVISLQYPSLQATTRALGAQHTHTSTYIHTHMPPCDSSSLSKPHTTSTKPQDPLKRCRKAFDKIQHPFMIKALTGVDIEGIYLNIIKAIYDKPMANIIRSDQSLSRVQLSATP